MCDPFDVLDKYKISKWNLINYHWDNKKGKRNMDRIWQIGTEYIEQKFTEFTPHI